MIIILLSATLHYIVEIMQPQPDERISCQIVKIKIIKNLLYIITINHDIITNSTNN